MIKATKVVRSVYYQLEDMLRLDGQGMPTRGERYETLREALRALGAKEQLCLGHYRIVRVIVTEKITPMKGKMR